MQKRMREVDERKKKAQEQEQAIQTKIKDLFLNSSTASTVLDKNIVRVIEKLKSFLKQYWADINSEVVYLHNMADSERYAGSKTPGIKLKEQKIEINNSINNLENIVNSTNTNDIPWYITKFFNTNPLTVDEIKIIKDNNIIKILKTIFKRMNGYIPDDRFSTNK
jgi:hypothetical protein